MVGGGPASTASAALLTSTRLVLFATLQCCVVVVRVGQASVSPGQSVSQSIPLLPLSSRLSPGATENAGLKNAGPPSYECMQKHHVCGKYVFRKILRHLCSLPMTILLKLL